MVRSPSCFTAVGTNGELLLARTLQSGMKTPKKLRRKELTTSIQSIRVSRRLSVRRDRPNELCKVLKRQLLPNRFHNNLVLNGGLRKNPKEEKMGMTTRSSVSQMEVTSLSDDPIGAKKTPLSCSNGGSTTGSELECRWLGCSYRIDGIDSSLANHILDAHVVQQRGQQGFICLWDGCKVATKPSKRLSWLETHVVEKHCGSRPYVCFLCTLRFASKPSLEKHVDSHFPLPEGQISEISRLNGHSHANGFSSSDELKKRQRRYFLTARDERIITRSQDRTQLIRSPLPPKPWPLPNDAVQTSSKPTEPLTLTIVESSLPIRSQETHVATSKAHVNGEGIKVPLPASSNGFISRRNRRKLKPTSRHKDFFDVRTVLAAKDFVAKNLVALRLRGKVLTFHSEIICERCEPSGVVTYLVRWKPEGFVADCWVGKEHYKESVTIPAAQLIQKGIVDLRC